MRSKSTSDSVLDARRRSVGFLKLGARNASCDHLAQQDSGLDTICKTFEAEGKNDKVGAIGKLIVAAAAARRFGGREWCTSLLAKLGSTIPMADLFLF